MASAVGGGLDEGKQQRMRFLFRRGELGMEQGGDEESVGGGFNGADLSLRAARDYGEAGFHGCPLVLRVHFEVAEYFFDYGVFVPPIKRLEVRAGAKPDAGHFAGQFGSVGLAIGHGASDGIDHDVLRSGIIFGAVGVRDAENVADELDQRVLEASAGSEEGP